MPAFNKSQEKGDLIEDTKSRVHLFLWPLVTAVCLIFATFHRLHVTPPPQLHIFTKGEEFSEGRTREFLTQLEGIGPKLVGTSANEVGATGLLISEIPKLPTFPGREWNFEGGLSLPFFIYEDKSFNSSSQSDGSFLDPTESHGCVCPESLTSLSIESSITKVHLRLERVLPLCAPKSLLQSSGTPDDWVHNARHALRILPKGCTTVGEWAAADIYLRYIEDSYGVEIYPMAEPQRSKLMENKQALMQLQRLAAGTIAARQSLVKLLENKICADSEALRACANGGEGLFRIERLTAQRMTKKGSKICTTFIDVSLSHQYSGNFLLVIAKGGELNNVYQNVTNLAVRILPMDLILNEQKVVDDLSQNFFNFKEDLLKRYNKLGAIQMTLTNSVIKQLTNGLSSPEFDIRRVNFREHLPPALMLASHFDSAVSSPGGADAGAGVSIVLEVCRNMFHRESE